MTVETRAIPKGTTPLTKQTFQTFSCLFMSNEAIPGEAKHAEFAIELRNSWLVLVLREFCDSQFSEGGFSWTARIVIGSIVPAFAFVC